MPRPISLQVYVSPELAEQVRAAAEADGLAVSEWLRSQLKKALANSPAGASERDLLDKLYRQSLFAFVGLDALLSGHPDHTLRERAHSAWKARCKEVGMAVSPAKGATK
ncbi:hypothetical protein ACFFF7_15280 [Novosphingobium aquiterrae]|uniref:Ribbon-helix-helix protein CopG domain-containing protein n=1 Tax=Novosphingobium aquiterrae TaxID=624388 RepID=A0ABV6PLR7_9SPHN